MDVPLEHLCVMDVVRQHHDAARRIHDIVVEVLAEPVPQFYRMIVDAGGFVVEVVGADDRRVAAGVAAPQPALFKHSDIGDAVLLCKVVGRGKSVPASAHDDDVIFVPGIRRRPLLFPPLVAAHGLPGYGKDRIFPHVSKPRNA